MRETLKNITNSRVYKLYKYPTRNDVCKHCSPNSECSANKRRPKYQKKTKKWRSR